MCADPVEQAILVDRTRRPRRPATPPIASCDPPPPLSAAPAAPAALAVASPSPVVAPPPPAREPDSGPVKAVEGVDLLGNYRIVAPIAAGGMGLLYLGEHRFLGYKVAIKLLQPSLRGDAEVERRFFAEALATSRIAHPGVPTVLDFGHDRRGTAYMVMEYLEGDTLAAHLARRTPFTLEQVLDIGAQAAAILGAAHGKNILHRDVKPDNIFLSPDPELPSGFRVKVLDFGVAKILADPPPNAEVTRHDYLVGTAWYMAPEQTFGPRGIDGRCDVYALGCVLFQLLTGRLPFMGEFEAVVQARRYQPPPTPRQYRPDLPRAIDAAIHAMLARDPDKRTATMATVERELRDLGVGERLSPIIPPGERTMDRVRRVVSQVWFRVGQWARRAWRSLERWTRLAWHRTRMAPGWVMAQPGWMVASCAAAVLLLVITVCVALI
ncbi:MAG TPA: serine/threonine-protein kinase [Kofleriaceae bacterium]|nr:serine/threonine-protein kinase [Kofleriaceae bacterium]